MPFAAWIWRMQGRVQRIETKLAYAEKEIARTVSENSKIFEKLNRIAEDVSAIKARLNHK